VAIPASSFWATIPQKKTQKKTKKGTTNWQIKDQGRLHTRPSHIHAAPAIRTSGVAGPEATKHAPGGRTAAPCGCCGVHWGLCSTCCRPRPVSHAKMAVGPSHCGASSSPSGDVCCVCLFGATTALCVCAMLRVRKAAAVSIAPTNIYAPPLYPAGKNVR
jgi:hypothetical protein